MAQCDCSSSVKPVLTKKKIPRPPGCQCGDALVDHIGRVMQVRTCPICMDLVLASMRGGEYACAYVNGEDTTKRVLLKQKEFFSFSH